MRIKNLAIIIILILSINILNAEEITSSLFVVDSNISDYSSGMTKELGSNDITIVTKGKEAVTLILPNKTLIKINENTTFMINQSLVNIDNLNSFPQTVKIKSTSYAFSLIDGTIDMINDNSSIYIHTQRVNLTTTGGQFKIIAHGKNTTVINNKGVIKALGLIKQRTSDIKEKTIGLITTYIPIVDDENLNQLNKPELNCKDIDVDDIKKLNDYFSILNTEKESMMFIVAQKKVWGIKILK